MTRRCADGVLNLAATLHLGFAPLVPAFSARTSGYLIYPPNGYTRTILMPVLNPCVLPISGNVATVLPRQWLKTIDHPAVGPLRLFVKAYINTR
jgi:hypothetical protein